jgi:hypothetical protein
MCTKEPKSLGEYSDCGPISRKASQICRAGSFVSDEQSIPACVCNGRTQAYALKVRTRIKEARKAHSRGTIEKWYALLGSTSTVRETHYIGTDGGQIRSGMPQRWRQRGRTF